MSERDLRLKLILEAMDRTGPAFNGVDGRLQQTRTGILGLVSAGRLLGGVLGGVTLSLIARDVFDVNREFQSLSASLLTVTDSEEAATRAFGRLQRFAAETPFQLQEVVQAFIKMKALGLDPSEEALRSYGNTASAMGKSLDQMVEAVADAATGEFERLKEFGIKARQNGDQVSLTFRGVTTTIGNNAREIEGYLRKIGETDFAGGMERQMETLGGATSNLSDSWDNLMRSIGEAGAADAAIGLFKELAGALNTFANSIALADAYADGKIGLWDWIAAGPEDAKALLAEIAEVDDELFQLEQRVRDLKAHKQGNFWWSNQEEKDLRAAIKAVEDYKLALALKADAADSAPVDLAAGTPETGDTASERKAREKLAEQWRKTQSSLSLDVEKLGLNRFEAKIVDINAKAQELRQQFGDLAQIELWRKAQVGAVELERDMAAVRAETSELEKSTEGALEAFRGFASQLETTGGAMAQITEGLNLYNHETDRAAAGTKDLAEEGSASFKELENAVEGWASGFSAQLNDMFWSADVAFSGILESFGRMLSQMVIQKQIVEPLLGAGLDFLGGLGSAPAAAPTVGGAEFGAKVLKSGGFNLGVTKFHEGGTFVPRFHLGGLNADEGYAILKGGERVQTEEQARTFDKLAALLDGASGGQGGGTTVQVLNNSGQQARTERGRGPDGRELVRVIIGEVARDIRQGGEASKAIAGTYGLNRQGVSRG